MAEIHKDNPDAAKDIANSFLDSYNKTHGSNFEFDKWDNEGKSWDFKAVDDGNKLSIEAQNIEAIPTHNTLILKKLYQDEKEKKHGVEQPFNAEHDVQRFGAAVGHKIIIDQRTGRAMPQTNIILLVIFRHLSYHTNSLPEMRTLLIKKGWQRIFKEIWVTNESGENCRID